MKNTCKLAILLALKMIWMFSHRIVIKTNNENSIIP